MKRNKRNLCFQILYTQPNPSIKYEYFTESLPGEVESEAVTKIDFNEVTPRSASKHYRRHHSNEVFSRPSGHVPREPEMSISMEDDIDTDVVVLNRKYMWKIMSYSQCSRTCGGGIQVSLDLILVYRPFPICRDL